MHWGHLVMSNGTISNRPIALEPRPEQGYDHNFSGSILANKISNPENPSQQVNAAFFTATGTGENGFVTFLQAPPTVMAITSDSTLNTWAVKRYTITDEDTYKDRIDTINGGTVTNAVLAQSDGTGGIPVTYDRYGVKVTDPVTNDTETLPLFASQTSSVTLDVMIDRSVFAVFTDGKMLHKVVNPPKQDSTHYASGVALRAAGGSVTFAEFSANSLR